MRNDHVVHSGLAQLRRKREPISMLDVYQPVELAEMQAKKKIKSKALAICSKALS